MLGFFLHAIYIVCMQTCGQKRAEIENGFQVSGYSGMPRNRIPDGADVAHDAETIYICIYIYIY